MTNLRTALRLLAHAAIISSTYSGAAHAQLSLDDQKKQAEIEKLEADRQKVLSDMIGASRTATAGSGTLTAPEASAEGLLLSRHVQEKTAKWIVQSLGDSKGPISIVFGEQPPSTAEYLGLTRGTKALKANLETAARRARDHYKATEPQCALLAGTDDEENGNQFEYSANFVGGFGLALSAVTTVASLLRVNTTFAGAALPAPNEQFKAVLTQELKQKGWTVDPARPIARSTRYATLLLDDMACAKNEAAEHYSTYLMHLARTKDGKPGSLPEAEVIVGQALATVLGDYALLEKGLFTPINGVLPASIIEDQAKLFEEADTRRILYIPHHKAALTSITKQGLLTGIAGIPAFVSASHVVEYSAHIPGGGDQYRTVRYDTKVMRVTGVKSWLDSEAAKNAVAVGAGH